ncbi:unnamed protein product [Meloidogyne enterolobii]|uniref:Uncharacterized protein n=2 Tax=Meloidogyne enterolobii TaxID=390850 RepID=A0ACB0ZVX0_MELEN
MLFFLSFFQSRFLYYCLQARSLGFRHASLIMLTILHRLVRLPLSSLRLLLLVNNILRSFLLRDLFLFCLHHLLFVLILFCLSINERVVVP